ncbi:MAG TPA: 16S rRNA (guanine(966)-N(2))-methyltransferase RsmD [Clostridiales bacterium]|nr:16S rRNA (guanine(966)-N(2))-methyltransferase RsmD [Clostridiales bacterium]
MRIITGTARGIRLESPRGDAVRPTTEIAKEGLFSSIQFEMEGRRVLDLFAGSGQLGLEALSRGAALAVFVDSSAAAVDLVKKNARKAGLFERCRVLHTDYAAYLKGFSGDPFDYIFVDPPYDMNAMVEIIRKLLKCGCVGNHTWIFCESNQEELDVSALPEVENAKRYKYGKTYVHAVKLV